MKPKRKYVKSGKPRKPRKDTYKSNMAKIAGEIDRAQRRGYALDRYMYNRDIDDCLEYLQNKFIIPDKSRDIIIEKTDEAVDDLLEGAKDIAAHNGNITVSPDDLFLSCKLQKKIEYLRDTDRYTRFDMDELVEKKLEDHTKALAKRKISTPGPLMSQEEVDRGIATLPVKKRGRPPKKKK